MRFLCLFTLAVLLSNNGYAQETTESKNDFNIMEGVLFLNADQRNNGAASIKADPEKKTVHYFGEDGRLIGEDYIDENNDIVSKRYNQEGQIIFEAKMTEESVNSHADDAQTRHEQVDVPEAKAVLQKLSEAAESYAKANGGNYPQQMTDLTEANPPYINRDDCHQSVNPQYYIKCDFNAGGYAFTAKSMWSQYESYVIKTGGVLEVAH